MWVKLNENNYFDNCYMDGNDPKINPFNDMKAAFFTLPSDLGQYKNECYILNFLTDEGTTISDRPVPSDDDPTIQKTDEEGQLLYYQYSWEFDQHKYEEIISNTSEGKLNSVSNAVFDLQDMILTISLSDELEMGE